jgi:uncharacterized protein (TIGR03435 family)
MRKPVSAHQPRSDRSFWSHIAGLPTAALMSVLLFTAPSEGQTGAATKQGSGGDAGLPTFDVVSIKRNNSGGAPAMIISPLESDQIIVKNASPHLILGEAYGIRLHDQIIGLPGWADSETYDIVAKVAESDLAAFRKLLPMQRSPMLQSVLVNRFHLASHFETRTLPAYALVTSKSGPKLKEVESGTLPDGRKDPGGIDMSRNQITATGASMLPLVHVLQMQLGRPVVDRTGLTGNYDFKLTWTPDPGATAAPADTESGPSLFTAIQEQLGLRLEPVRAPVQILVVDHIERPSEN